MYSTCVVVRHTCTLCMGTGCVQPHMPTLSVAQCHGALPAFRIRPLMCGQKMRLTKGRPLPYQLQAKRANIASRISSTFQCRHSNLCGRYAEYNVHGHHGLTLPSPAFWCGCVHAASRDCQTVVHVSTYKSMPALSTEACTLCLHTYVSKPDSHRRAASTKRAASDKQRRLHLCLQECSHICKCCLANMG